MIIKFTMLSKSKRLIIFVIFDRQPDLRWGLILDETITKKVTNRSVSLLLTSKYGYSRRTNRIMQGNRYNGDNWIFGHLISNNLNNNQTITMVSLVLKMSFQPIFRFTIILLLRFYYVLRIESNNIEIVLTILKWIFYRDGQKGVFQKPSL